ncbi:MAG: hypothetical protein V2A76_00630 [Planctomycetota bacterium]
MADSWKFVFFLLLALSGSGSAGARDVDPPPLVATHFFYWYRYPDEHFPTERGGEGHRHQFMRKEQVSYESADWYEGEFQEMARAGIDIALPVYWGAPGAYERPGIRFSRAGLKPMVKALDRLQQRSLPRVKLGLFYDTSTLLNDVRGAEPRGGRADLTADSGRDLFCRTVIEYFEQIPSRHWARLNHDPLDGAVPVVLYGSAFAAAWDPGLGDHLRAAFSKKFPNERICLVADVSWGDIGQDLTTAWGAALTGPKLFDRVAQIGPGYDDTQVPGRRTPIREREEGDFYRWSWQQALAYRPELVILETWNEMHEGTELCPSKELGDLYSQLTRVFVDRLKQGLAPGPPITLRQKELLPREDLSFGREAEGLNAVTIDYASEERIGLTEGVCEDGPFRIEGGWLRAGGAAEKMRYLYFRVSDYWRFNVDEELWLVVTREPGGSVSVQYDSRDEQATLSGAYTQVAVTSTERQGSLVVERYRLPGARLANRQNSGSDLRLAFSGSGPVVRRIELRAD